MNKIDLPSISIIIPVFNEEKKLPGCLESIRTQDYPQSKLEILIVDDNSTDNTVTVAQRFGTKILNNGSMNIERGKTIGLSQAKNDYILLLDADNRLPHQNWLEKLVRAMEENPIAVGAEAIWFQYNAGHTITDRYCELFGVNDPMAYYLNRRDRLMATESKWNLPGKIIKETKDYYLIEFNKENLLTVGSQGFLTRKSLLLKTIWQPYLFHMDSNTDLINQGHNQFLMIKDTIIHLHSNSLKQFVQKLQRNFKLFLQQENIRRYTWRTKPLKLIIITLLMITMIKPFFDSLKGFFKKPNIAWFLHPFFCFYIPAVYLFYLFRGSKFNKIFHAELE